MISDLSDRVCRPRVSRIARMGFHLIVSATISDPKNF